MLVILVNQGKLPRDVKRPTNADRLLTLETLDIDVSMHPARSERFVRKPCVGVPGHLLLTGWQKVEGIISDFHLE